MQREQTAVRVISRAAASYQRKTRPKSQNLEGYTVGFTASSIVKHEESPTFCTGTLTAL